jgi:hypothetical protein
MATSKAATSKQLKEVLRRVRSDSLTAADKALLTKTLQQQIELRQLLERATKKSGKKKVVASLPFGFDLVK